MFHLIARRLLPAPLHRFALRCAHALRIRWWQLRRPLLEGCRVLAVNPQGEVLLVRHSYGSNRWMLPGGGIAGGETPIAAATRELAEETACTLVRPVEIAVTRSNWHGADNVVHVIAGHTDCTPRADGREILAARCFAPGDLPRDINRGLAEQLPGWLGVTASEQR